MGLGPWPSSAGPSDGAHALRHFGHHRHQELERPHREERERRRVRSAAGSRPSTAAAPLRGDSRSSGGDPGARGTVGGGNGGGAVRANSEDRGARRRPATAEAAAAPQGHAVVQSHHHTARPPTPKIPLPANAGSRVANAPPTPSGLSSRDGPEAVIFLDVDGVLHPLYGFELFNGTCCSLLSLIVRATGASIVLSSAWRTQARSYDTVNQVLKQLRLPPIIARTKDLSSISRKLVPREFEICEWLDRHPGVRKWIAIDDMDLQSAPNEAASRMRGHFVHTNPCTGLTQATAELAIKLMKRQDSAHGPRR